MNNQQFAVIMAGGRGTRFWPLSRTRRPKLLLRIFNGKSLIRQTIDRILPLFGPKNILIVTVQDHYKQVRRELKILPRGNFLIEPQGRNTGPCVALAAMEIYRRNPKGIMVVLPADHWVQKEGLFRRTINAAIRIAHAQDDLITIGIRPTHPETGYGYISTNKQHRGPYGISVSKVKSFKEKPDPEEAVRLIRRGALWNSGIFVWKAEAILAMLGRFAPRISRCLQKIIESIGKGSRSSTHPKAGAALRSQYRKMPNISIDHAVLEKAGARGRVLTLQANFHWSDVGNWASLYTLLSHDRRGNAAIGDWLGIDSRNCLIYSTDRLIVLLGMRNALVVDSPDALLVGDLKRAQDIREIVKRLSLKDTHRYLVN